MIKEVEKIQVLYNVMTEFIVNYSFQLMGAVIIFLIGLYVAKKTAKFIHKLCEKNKIDITLATFIASLTRILIIVMVAVICLGKLGISVTPMVAAIGAVSLGAGLALQGLLSNYGAGFTIIITSPFIVGDTIRIHNITGVVKKISLARTILENEDEVEIIIPNKHIIGEIYYNSKANKLVEVSIGVEYSSDPEKIIALIEKTLLEIPEITKEPQAQIGIDEFADSSINIGLRYWVPTRNYFQVKYRANLAIFKALKKSGITIPFPQREVRLLDKETHS